MAAQPDLIVDIVKTCVGWISAFVVAAATGICASRGQTPKCSLQILWPDSSKLPSPRFFTYFEAGAQRKYANLAKAQ